jgi:CheY-like chemotaxis protein
LPDIIRVLVVEDDAAALKSWEGAVEMFNANDDAQAWSIDATYAKTREEAQALVSSRKFDAAVIDLRLKVQPDGNQNNDEGNAVVEFLAQSDVAAIAIHTGQPGEAQLSTDRPHVRVIEKGEGLDPVIEWVKGNSDIILQVQRAKRTIQREMAALFHTSIWPRWKFWVQDAAQPAALHPAVARHLISHVHAGMLEQSGGTVHPEEWYFVPPVRSRQISTGDLIVTAAGVVEIVITPRCDLAHADKSETIQLASCQDIAADWTALESDASSVDQGKAEKARQKIKNWQQHRTKAVLHYLPRMVKSDEQRAGPWFVRFDRIRSVDKTPTALTELQTQRFASLTSEFLPSLVERLGAYFSRIGTPDPSELA